MERGYVKLWRKSLDSRVFNNEGLWKLWTWCLMKATHKKRWATIKTGKSKIEVEILPGQFIYGRLSAAKQLKMKPSTVRNRMEKLKNMQNLDIKKDNQYSIISILNWGSYQPKKEKKDSKEDSQRTAKGQPKDTDKNVNNIYSDKLKTFVSVFNSYILKKYPRQAQSNKITWESNSLEVVNNLIRLDGFEENYIYEVIRWAKKDDFWNGQLFSLAGLRKKNGGRTKFQKIVASHDKAHPEVEKGEIVYFNEGKGYDR